MFESVGGGLLEELGYEILGPVRQIHAPERAWWWIEHYVLYVLTRLTKGTPGERLKSFLLLKTAGLGVRRSVR